MSFLTEEYHKSIKREKLKKLAIIFVVLLTVVGAIGTALMLTSYFILAFSKDATFSRLKATELVLASKDFKNMEDEANRINNLTADFEKNEMLRKKLAPLILKISNATPPAITLKVLRLDAKSEDIAIMTINGTAETRDSFLAYYEKLKNFEEAAAVISPITNLLRETNVSFALEFRIKKEFYSYVSKK